MHAIGIDVGSTNVKVSLVDEGGAVVRAAGRPLATSTTGDRVSQDPDALWTAVRSAVREATAGAPDAATDVATIGVCSQYSSLVPVDAEGTALAPVKLYLDSRGAGRCWEILEAHPDAFDLWIDHHGIPPVGGGLTLSHLLHFQYDEPEVHARAAAYLEVMDLVNLRLTGRVAATQCTMFASQLVDNRSVGTTEYDAELLERSAVDPATLPPLSPLDGVHGHLPGDVAVELGLPEGTEVRAGMNDTQAGAFATGALGDPGRCGLMIGTTAVLIQAMDGPGVDLEREVLAMPAPLPGRYVVMAENGIAGRAVERALELLSPTGRDGDAHFAELTEALDTSAPGAGGVLFLPWLAGSMSPASTSTMRGGFLGVTLQTERADLLRATVEGVARNLRWLLPAVQDLSGNSVDELVLGGGAARAPGVPQVLADVLDRPVSVLERPELAAATAVGRVALARHRGEDPAVVRLRAGVTLQPEASATAVHDRLQPLFEEAFSANRPICQALES